MRLAVLAAAAVSVAVTLAAALVPPFAATYDVPALHAAVATAGPLIVLFAGILVLICFFQRTQASDLALVCSLIAFGLSQLASAAVPAASQRLSQVLLVWVALAGRSVGAAMFALAAFAPHRRLARPGLALASGVTAVIATVLLTAVLVVSLAPGRQSIDVVSIASPVAIHADLHADAVLLGLGAAVAMTCAVAAVGFVRRTRDAGRFGDKFPGWLALSAILAAAAQVNWTLHPALSRQVVSLGEVFGLCSRAAVLTGSALHICSLLRSPSGMAVIEERRRIARDLHDGLAQELAYLRRHLDALGGIVNCEMNGYLLRAVERADNAARVAVNGLAPPQREPVNVTVARVVGELAARDDIELQLDIPPGIRLPAARAEALMRIACEAVGNAARHSGAGRVTLTVRPEGPRVRLRVADSGSGFDPSLRPDGFGLASMLERATLVGGDLRISSAPGAGTEVEATL